MARGFNGTSDHILLGVNSLGPLYNGASAVSTALWFYCHSTPPSALQCWLASVIGLNRHALGVQFAVSGGLLRVGGRSTFGDSYVAGGSLAPSANQWNFCGGVLDFANDTIRTYVNGSGDQTTAVGFGSTTYAHTTSTRDDDCIGCYDQNGLQRYTYGYLAEVAVWKIDIGTPAMDSMAKGFAPSLIRGDQLIAHWHLMGRNSPELEEINNIAGTVSGTTTQPHPSGIIYPSRVLVGRPPLGITVLPAAAIAAASAMSPSVVLGSISLTPAQAEALAAALDPAVVLGSITLTPAVAEALASALDPSVLLGSTMVTPAEAIAQATALDPLAILGSTTATPAQAGALAAALDPSTIMGSITLTPAVAEALASCEDPVVTLGSIVVTPAVAEALAQTLDPDLILGSMSVTPAVIEALASALDPNVIIEGEPAEKTLRIINLLWTFGAGVRR